MSGLPVTHRTGRDGGAVCGATRRWGALTSTRAEDVTCKKCRACVTYEVHRDGAVGTSRTVVALDRARAVRTYSIDDDAGWNHDGYDELLWVRAVAPNVESEPGQAYRVRGKDGVRAARDLDAEQAWREAERDA